MNSQKNFRNSLKLTIATGKHVMVFKLLLILTDMNKYLKLMIAISQYPKGLAISFHHLGSVHILRNHVRGGWGVQAHLITLIMP